MKLPRADDAVVDIRKLRDYCLNPNHPNGRHKARVFRSALGLTAVDADTLRYRLLDAARRLDAWPAGADAYGRRYIVDVAVEGRGGSAIVRSCWLVRPDEEFPRLTTCYVL